MYGPFYRSLLGGEDIGWVCYYLEAPTVAKSQRGLRATQDAWFCKTRISSTTLDSVFWQTYMSHFSVWQLYSHHILQSLSNMLSLDRSKLEIDHPCPWLIFFFIYHGSKVKQIDMAFIIHMGSCPGILIATLHQILWHRNQGPFTIAFTSGGTPSTPLNPDTADFILDRCSWCVCTYSVSLSN